MIPVRNGAACAIAGVLALAAPAEAQLFIENFAPIDEATRVTGPYARYERHVLKLGRTSYAVLFRPGFVDGPTAARAVEPLCREQALRAVVQGEVAPVDLVIRDGEAEILQGVRVACLPVK